MSKYKNRKSPPVSAQDNKNKIMIGNDKNKWISLPDVNGIYKWKHYEEQYEIDKQKNFTLEINHSRIIPKKNKKISCILTQKELLLDISSKNFAEFDNKKLTIPFSKLKSNDDPAYVIFGYISNEDSIIIHFDIDQRSTDQRLLELIDEMEPLEMNSDMLAKTEHMYGTLELLTVSKLRKLKKKEKYYIVWGQTWNTDITGKYSIAVLEYDDIIRINSAYPEYVIDGIVYYLSDGKINEFTGEDIGTGFCDKPSCYFHTGSGSDPVHIVTKFRKGFKPPIKLSNLFNR